MDRKKIMDSLRRWTMAQLMDDIVGTANAFTENFSDKNLMLYCNKLIVC